MAWTHYLKTNNDFSEKPTSDANLESLIKVDFDSKLKSFARNLHALPRMWYKVRAQTLNVVSYHLPFLLFKERVTCFLIKSNNSCENIPSNDWNATLAFCDFVIFLGVGLLDCDIEVSLEIFHLFLWSSFSKAFFFWGYTEKNQQRSGKTLLHL